MATTKIYLDVRRVRSDGTFPLKIAIFHKKKVALIPLGIYLMENQWDERRCAAVNHPNKIIINGFVNKKHAQVSERILNLTLEGKIEDMSAYDIKYNITCKKEETKRTKKFEEAFIEFTQKKSGSTKLMYEYTLKRLRKYCTGLSDIKFEDVDVKFLEGFDSYLFQGGGKSKNYRSIRLRHIRAVFNYSIGEEYTSFYPFRRFKIQTEETRKRSLTVDELRHLFDYPVEPYAEIYRDMFKLIFMLIGINTVDLYALKSVTKDGRVEYKRAKTGRLYSIKVEPEAIEIIDKYKGENGLLCIADRWSDHNNFLRQMNAAINRIGIAQGKGRKDRDGERTFANVTSYYARHTWATIAYSIGVSKDIIAQSLGHYDGHDVTNIYINEDLGKVDEANRKVIDWVLYGKK